MSQPERHTPGNKKKLHNQNLRIKISAYNNGVLYTFAKKVKASVKPFWSELSGPIPLPTQNDRYTVPTSPHVYKTAQEHFEKKLHTVLIVIKNPNAEVVKAISEISIPDSIQIKIQLQND